MQTLNISADLNDELDLVYEPEPAVDSTTAGGRASDKPPLLSRALNSTICCGCMLLLSPAIVAVWIAIRRSAATGDARVKRTRAQRSDVSARSIRIVMKPDQFRSATRHVVTSDTAIGSGPKIAAHAAL